MSEDGGTHRLVPDVPDDAGHERRLASQQGHVAAALRVVEVGVAQVDFPDPGRARVAFPEVQVLVVATAAWWTKKKNVFLAFDQKNLME